MFLLVGLGNPGKEYENNRHNIGFMAIDAITQNYSFDAPKLKFHGEVNEGRIGSTKVRTIKPSTFMNESGKSVGAISQFYKIPIDNIIVFHDELDLVPGKLKVKQGGSHAGHNGLKSLNRHIASNYIRVRLGIGHPGDKRKVSSYVLSNFNKQEQPIINQQIDSVVKHLTSLLNNDAALFMNNVAKDMNGD